MGISTSYTLTVEKGAPDDWVETLPDLRFPRYAAIDVTNDPRSALDVSLRLVFDEKAGQYLVDTLIAHRRDRQSHVDGTSLRTIPVQEFMRELEWGVKIIGSGETLPNPLPQEIIDEVRSLGPGSIEALRWVARVYAAAHALWQPPAKAVQAQLQMPAPTASVWIRRARDRGLIQDTFGQAEFWMSEDDFERSKRALRDG